MERYNATRHAEREERDELLRELLGEVGEGVVVRPPFRCDYGTHITIGAGTFVNYDCVMLDVAPIPIGAACQLATGVQLLTATTRSTPSRVGSAGSTAKPISIGDNVWLGGGVIVCPGVTIGDNTVVGAGAVVTRDLPADVVAFGNPARVQREIDERDRVDIPTCRRGGGRLASEMAVDERKIAVLGAGQIGEALISGLLSSGWRTPVELAASTRREERAAELRERHGIEVTLSNADAAAGAALVVIAVKPQDIEALLGEIGPLIQPEQTVLSIAAAIPTTTIERQLGSGVPVVRAMPNTPAVVHEGMAAVCAGAHAAEEHLTLAEEALRHLGAVVRVSEPYMDAVTAVSGSGPAYFALLAEAMIEAGILLGLSREVSTQLVVQTMLGTAKQLRDQKMHPVELREMVTSPGGTTIAAIRELEQAGVRAAFLNAIQAAMDRSRELASGDT